MFYAALLIGALCIYCDTDWTLVHIGNTVLGGTIVIVMYEIYAKYKDK